MVKRYVAVLVLAWLCTPVVAGGAAAARQDAAQSRADADGSAALRTAAALLLEERRDARSLATAAALTFVGPPRSKAETGRAAAAALPLAVAASNLESNDPAIAWLRLRLCADAPACNIREAATTMRWVDADNGAAWLPTLAEAQRDRDAVQVDRVLDDMAEGTRFDFYGSRLTVLMFDALKRVRGRLPRGYLQSDANRLAEARGMAAAVVMPTFSPLINACREAATQDRRDACLKLSKTLQRSDAVMAQLVGFAVEKRLTPTDAKELKSIAERRRALEWRVAAADASEATLLPWLRNARARSRLAKMRATPREEDVSTALLREHGMPLDPPEEHR